MPLLPNPALLASIPSPSSSSINLGPFELRAYGIALAVGVLVALWITHRRWISIGGSSDTVSRMAFWVIPAGIVGARIYHVITDFNLYNDNLSGIFQIWEGGLGIWGGVAAGAIAMYYVLRRSGESVGAMMWAAAPAVPVGQAIGRLGNWFNQELFGRPTDLPWALEIDPSQRPVDYLQSETFHPTFLYEALWNLALAAALIWLAPRLMSWLRPHNGALVGAYMVGYTAGRVWIELLRIDIANEIAGLRVNVWTSIVVGLAGIVILVVAYRRSSMVAEPEGSDLEGSDPEGSDSEGPDPEDSDSPDGLDDSGDFDDRDGSADGSGDGSAASATGATGAADSGSAGDVVSGDDEPVDAGSSDDDPTSDEDSTSDDDPVSDTTPDRDTTTQTH